MHNSFCTSLIPKVFHKQTREITVFHINNNFANLAVFNLVTFIVY